MDEQAQCRAAYEAMVAAMIQKDEAGLRAVLDEGFVLVHMTGMRQSKSAFIQAVMDGTLNYFTARHEAMPVTVTGDTAALTGRSVISAAVFGSGRHTWRLQQQCTLRKSAGVWRITRSVASTY